jgi:MFS superfamily sulfate permease-like transporter
MAATDSTSPPHSHVFELLATHTIKVVAVVLGITAALVVPFLAMAPEESASTEPGGSTFVARDLLDERFVSAVFQTPFVAEANGGDVLLAAPLSGIASVVVMACVAQVLHLTGIRSELVPQLDVDDELRASAGANLAASIFGVTPGFHGFGYTVLLGRLGARRRAVSVISGALVVAFGVVGVAAVGYVPRLIIGALVVMTGLALLDDWLQAGDALDQQG